MKECKESSAIKIGGKLFGELSTNGVFEEGRPVRLGG